MPFPTLKDRSSRIPMIIQTDERKVLFFQKRNHRDFNFENLACLNSGGHCEVERLAL